MTKESLENVVDVKNNKGKYEEKFEDMSILVYEDKSERTTTIEVDSNSYQKFSFFEDTKYDNNYELKNQNILNDIKAVWRLGVTAYVSGTTSSSSSSYPSTSSYDKIRKDELKRRAKIAYMLKDQESKYPNFRLSELQTIIDAILVGMDSRTKEKYLNIVKNYSTKNSIKGTFNVEKFYDHIPQKYIESVRDEL